MKILDLHQEHLLTLAPGAAQRVQVLYGRVWLTETGRSEDIFACSGEVIDLSASGLVLVEGLGFARIAVFARADAGVRAGRLLRRLPQHLRARVQRLRAATFGTGAARPAA